MSDTKDKTGDARNEGMQYNSLDFLVSTNRLSVVESRALGVYCYGLDNNYPTKITEAAKRSSSLVSSIAKQSRFVAGLGFEGATAEDVKNGTAIVVNESGLTAYELLQFCADQKSNINIAIHVNFNALGEAVEFTPIQYDFVRIKVPVKDEKFSRYIITAIWHLENDRSNYMMGINSKIEQLNKWIKDKAETLDFSALEVFDYNPDPAIVREQIELSGGIEKYSGQLFYKKRTMDIYQTAIYDSVIDDAQFEAEVKLYGLSNIQNGFSIGGFLKHFADNNTTKEIEDIKKKMAHTKGPINAGRIWNIPVPMNADARMPTNLFEPTQHANIDKLYEAQKKEAKDNIQEVFSIPNVLFGRSTDGSFATEKVQENFDMYNSQIRPVQLELEIDLTTLFRNSNFDIKLPIEIIPLEFKAAKKVDSKTEE